MENSGTSHPFGRCTRQHECGFERLCRTASLTSALLIIVALVAVVRRVDRVPSTGDGIADRQSCVTPESDRRDGSSAGRRIRASRLRSQTRN
jgi:hypothetical protein